MKTYLTTFLILVLVYTSKAQHSIGLKINVGLSKVSSSFDIPVPYENKFQPSGSAGVYHTFELSERSYLLSELLFTQIEGREDHDNNSNGFDVIIHKHISYLSLPVSYGLRIKKATIHLGFQISRKLGGSEKIEWHNNADGTEGSLKSDYTDILNYDWGPRIGALYELTEKFTMEAYYYYGLNDIGGTAAFEWKIQQGTIGLRYKMWSINK